MTREEFARRWLTPGVSVPLPQKIIPTGRVRLTDNTSRMFREQAPPPSRLVRTGRFLRRWLVISAVGAVLFVGMAALLIKLSPYVSDYAATYLSPH